MKKVELLIGLVFIVSGIFLTSCQKDEVDQNPPTITLLTGVHAGSGLERVTADTTVEAGEVFVIGFTAKTGSDKNLSEIVVNRTYENIDISTVWDTGNINIASYTRDLLITAYEGTPGSEEFELTVTDKNGTTGAVSFVVTTIPGDPGIWVFTNVEMGSYTSQIHNGFSSSTGNTHFVDSTGVDDESLIDWVYYDGTNGNTFISPSNPALYNIYPVVQNWTSKNNTLFEKSDLTEGVFDDISDKDELIYRINNTIINGLTLEDNFFSELTSEPGGISGNDIFVFQTQNNKKGLIKIKQVNQGFTEGESTIKFDIKVEK